MVAPHRHDSAPLFENIERFRQTLKAPFYCPGHKGGRSLPAELCADLGAMDLNNLPDTDTLHCPSGAIRDAEELLADAYGVQRSFMMVGGSSLGNMAAVMSVVGPNDCILVQRNAHKSVVAGIIHSGATPQWLLPTYDSRFGICHGVATETVAHAVASHPHAKALLVLNPTYFGVVPHLTSIAQICADRDIVLIADEAHGPHFRFGTGYPKAAENFGADLVVQSTHKILSGLSQAAVLHICSSKIESARVQAALQAMQTTSPNFAIMASIDLARRQMMQEGVVRMAAMYELAESARARINAIDGIRCMGYEHAMGDESGFYAMDNTKLVIDVSQLGWSGGEAQRMLNRQFGVQPELSGPGYLLCILTIGSIAEDVDHLVRGLEEMSRLRRKLYTEFRELNELAGRVSQRLPERVLLPREAFYSKHVSVAFEKVLGCVSGEIITPYPPGIPVIVPGERFDRDTIELLAAVKQSACPISAVDNRLDTVRVVASEKGVRYL